MKDTFFSDAFATMPPEERELYRKTVIMHMPSEHAEELRVRYYSGLLRHAGKNIRIGCGVKIVNPQWISLGDNVVIGDRCTLIARGEGGITLGDGARLMDGVYLDTERDEGYINVGRNVYIGTNCCLHGHVGLEIGDDSLLAQNITITPYSHIFDDPDKPIAAQGGHTRKITIGRDCYIGMCVCILYSADIGEGSVIGASSTVVKSIPPYSVAVGSPARVIRKRGEPKS
ncbi:MAG: acyltransferase [Clostridiales bacterium]|jgi:acetyltransferase-like isoleucine patch superfamily enzyme|nr:acyltransferase [Clostridiales bacterium]